MAFHNIIGNNRVKKILRKSLQKSRVPNSMLFCGPEGLEKKDVAMVLAKALCCLQKTDDACEACLSCKAINAGNFPDVMVISPVNGALKISQMRELKQTAYLKPMIAKKRIFIVESAEKMGIEASNSLLKVLEEPPSFSHIILLANNPDLILPTIKSRCQILIFSPISREEMENLLVDRDFAREKAKVISFFVRGNLKQALTLEWEDIQIKRKRAWELFLSLMREENASSFLKEFSSSRDFSRLELEELFGILSSFCRDLLLVKEEGDDRLLMNPDYKTEVKKINNLVSYDKSMDILREIDYAIYALQKNLNVNLLVSKIFSDFMEWKYA